jgi:ssDNA-binding Zn-finger/Zn-ribbon topoisomerase 1
MSPSTLERRVEALEASGGNGGCDRCRGVLVIVSNAMTGEFHSARWRGEALSDDEARERRAETRCPKCGARMDPDEAPVIKVGGLRRAEPL